MALRPCKECGQQISTDAKVCPHCGKNQKQSVTAGGALGIFILLLVLFGVLASMNSRAPTLNSGGSIPTSTGAGGIQEPAQPSWDYSSHADKMGRGTAQYATLESVNEVDFDFPYNGGSKAIITLRNSPKYGKNVIFQVTKGQILCHLDGCRVNVKVDEGHPVPVDADEAADGSSNVIFLPYSSLLRDLRRAKTLRIEANFYQEGSRVFEFHPKGLDVNKLTAGK